MLTSARFRSISLVAPVVLGALVVMAALVLGCRVERSTDVSTVGAPVEIEGGRWQRLPVEYCTVPNATAPVEHTRFVQLTAEAFAAWGVDVAHTGDCEALEDGNGRNEVAWGVPPESVDDPHHAGFTRQFFRACRRTCEGGARSELVEADILVHPNPPPGFEEEACIYATLLHETGHFLGVPHLDAPAVMAASTSECAPELTEADRQALRDLYAPLHRSSPE